VTPVDGPAPVMPVGAGGERMLNGVRVLELSTHVSGAYCGLLLSALGANVMRWDAPLAIDCPPHAEAEASRALCAGKRVIAAADLPAEVDLVVFDSLQDDAYDGVWAAASMRARDALGDAPHVIDIGGIRTGSRAGEWLPATSATVSAFSAMSWAIGAKGRPPLALPYDISGYLAGSEAAAAACLALLTGRFGADVGTWDVAESDVVASYVGQICSNFVHYGRPWARDGARASKSGGFYPAAMFSCKDGFVSLFCRTNREWANLVRAMGDPAWSKQAGFDDARIIAAHHADEADVHLKAWVANQTWSQIRQCATQYGFPIARVMSANEARAQQQFRERGLISAQGSTLRVTGTPWAVHYSHTAASPGQRELRLEPTPAAPLSGLKVLDLTWVWSGPMLTAALADLGAHVIKVEGKRRPDPSRLRGAAVRGGVPITGPELELSPYFNQMNRGKRSVGIDITSDRGAALVRELAARSDVVVENMRPGALKRRGLGYEQLREGNPGLVMLSMSMMGQTGPLRDMGGYAPVMSGFTGLDSLVGYSREELMGLYNPALGDPNGAGHGLGLLLAALYRRASTGLGAWLDLSQTETLMSILRVPVILADEIDPVPPAGLGHGGFAPHGTYRCQGDDAWVAIAARTPAERATLASVVEVPDADPARLDAALMSWCAQRTNSEVADTLTGRGVPAAAVQDFEMLECAAWSQARRLSLSTAHPYIGKQNIYSLTWKFDGRSYAAKCAAPLFGANSRDVLRTELGLGSAEIDELSSSGVLVVGES
jgi:crotonobetainyl-CoA:carnitine CoA-transferase CaiB-like acyl-CoA transferase